jgi:uncharacterized repeat protein (TIGR01451 family)
MKKTHIKLALTTATTAVLAFSGVSTASAADLELAAQQPSVNAEITGDTDGVYLVRLADRAIATYDGGIKGLAPTSAQATGKKRLDTKSKAAQKYKKHLKEQQSDVLDGASDTFGRDLDAIHTYQYATNGFAVELTVEEAKAMRGMDGVVSVQRERMERLLTDAGPSWIGAPEIWNNKPSGTQGEGVVVAVLDTGINSDHPSFADIGGDGYDHTNPLGSENYLPGSYCDVTDASFCNDKLIGAWDMVDTDGTNPEDNDGHGSHTASTAAGNVIDGAELIASTTSAFFDISGVAPHANVIAYDVCDDGCPGSSLAAAIDQVLVDAGNLPNGIAALNYSISGGGNPYDDYVELGFLAAVQAGVYVSASAGNDGPGAGTVAHLGPWTSTTASSTHNRAIVNSLIDLDSTGGGTADIAGLGFTAGYGPAPIINSADLEGAFPGSTLCGLGGLGDFIPPWPPGTFSGEIVACTRGTFGRVEKGANVLAAGAGGYVLMDNGGGLVGDAHVLPGVHISLADRATLEAWLAANSANSPMASIEGFSLDLRPANGDVMAGTSSRGPQSAFDVLKPDVTAPGVDIMAAEANGQGLSNPEYQIISGTSMSSPHNAGSGALLTALRPDLTPQEIKSAIMLSSTTEFTVKEDGVTPTDPFDLGAGRVDLGAAKDAGLVMSESTANFLAADPNLGGDPSTLNLASMMNSKCVGSCSWTRTVTNPENNTSHWNVTTSGPAGLGLESEVSPEANSDDYNLSLKKGQDATITVTADTTLLPDGWYFGTVNLDRNLDKGPDLHMPIAVYAAKASNANVFTKTVDSDTAAAGDILTYEIKVTNGPMSGPITVTDVVPAGTTFVPASETESVVNGSTSSAWSYDGGSNSLSWTGELDLAGMVISPTVVIGGYLPMAGFFAPIPNPSGCDEGGYNITGLDIFYNGQHYTDGIWSVNGTFELGGASGSTTGFVNAPMPDAASPNNLLAPFWGDMNLCTGGNWYLGGLTDGVSNWDIFEWEAVPEWPAAGANTYQIWLERGTSNITFIYGPTTAVIATVGAENTDGTVGDTWYFNGAGTPVAANDELAVLGTPGGSATLGFEVEADCSQTAINQADLSNSAGDETAIAVTTCP